MSMKGVSTTTQKPQLFSRLSLQTSPWMKLKIMSFTSFRVDFFPLNVSVEENYYDSDKIGWAFSSKLCLGRLEHPIRVDLVARKLYDGAGAELQPLASFQVSSQFPAYMLSSMRRPAKTPIVPMMHTTMNKQSRMWSSTMATNFHSSVAWRRRGQKERIIKRGSAIGERKILTHKKNPLRSKFGQV